MNMSNKTIGNICYLLNGYAFKSSHYVDNGIRVIRIANVQKGYIEDSTPAFYPYDSKGLENYMLKEGDLLMSLTGNVGRVALLNGEMLPAALNQRVACLRLKDNSIDKKFLFHYLNSSNFENKCIKESKGIAQKNMSTEWLKRQEIPNFTYTKQKEISKVIDYVSDIIKAKMKQLSEYDQLIKSRFFEIFGDINTNSKGWNQKTLKDICVSIGDGLHGTPKYDEDGFYPFINGNNLIDGKIVITSKTKRTNEVEYLKLKKEIGNNALLLSINGTLGKVAVYNNEKISLGKSVCYLNLKNDLNRIFVMSLINSDEFQVYLDKSSTKSTINNVSLKAIREYKIIVPDKKVQENFAQFVQVIDKQKGNVQKSLDETQRLFDSLMQEYFG